MNDGIWSIPGIFAKDWVTQMNDAHSRKDWDELSSLYREAKHIQRELANIVKAYETMSRYGLTVQ